MRGEPDVPLLSILAAHDRIAPAATAPPGRSAALATGHVGMVVGSARTELHALLKGFLTACR
jgi:polyhydroxyalkanoate synthase